MSDEEVLRKQLLELRMQLVLTKDFEHRKYLKEQVNIIHKSYAELLLEEKNSESRKGR